jgi:anti-anti-sigma factor
MIQKQILNENTALVTTSKVLDNSNAHEMVEVLTNLQNEGYKFLIIDIQELEFLSSAGVGSILGTIEVSREAGGDTIICNSLEEAQKLCAVGA